MAKLRSPRVEQLLIQTLDELNALAHPRVLDIGAGQVIEKNRRLGFHELANRYARLVEKGGYIGLEIDDESRPAVVGDAHLLPFADCSMDAVLMVSVLEHLCDPIRAVEQVHRVLRPSGVFFSYAPFYHPYHASPHDYFRMTREGYGYLLRQFAKVQFVSGGNYIAVLNDVMAMPGMRRGRIGRLLARAFVELPLSIPFKLFDANMDDRVAVGFAARAVK